MPEQTAIDRIVVRQAKPGDAAAIARLAGELGYAAKDEATERRMRNVLDSATDLLVVATEADGTIVGWLQAHSSHLIASGFRVEIVGLVVSSRARRRGIGRALVQQAECWAQSLSARTVVVRSNVMRTESRAFYPSLDYAPCKTQTVYSKEVQARSVSPTPQ